MARRSPTVTQADIARTIRAMLAAGLKVTRVVTRADAVEIETSESESRASSHVTVERKKAVVL